VLINREYKNGDKENPAQRQDCREVKPESIH